MKKCIKLGTEIKNGEKVCYILRNDVKIAENIPAEQIDNYFVRMEKEAKKNKQTLDQYLDNLLETVFILGRKFDEHIEVGHITIEIVNSKIPKKIKVKGKLRPNPDYIIEEYKYILGKGRSQSSIKPPYQARIKGSGGSHIIGKINNQFVRIVESATHVIPSGETIRIATIKYWIEEKRIWKLKDDIHTFFPSNWNLEKIRHVVNEASGNIIEKQGNRVVGKTKNGIKIEMRIDLETREVLTAYIVIN
ncbi:MAG: EndoU domain-containing protein [Candidatus Chryseobacterium colombiense]|nr:EndoU domain-containing protein [Chryseobacterium sp.]WEK69008.1 MAG: EndoU domain-containing protein [Chryseobacterium sp.]